MWVSLQWRQCDVIYIDYIWQRCHWHHPIKNIVLLFIFGGLKGLSANFIHSWDASGVLWDQQYMFCVTSCSWSRNCCWWGKIWSQCCFNTDATIAAGIRKLLIDGINVWTNLDDTLKKKWNISVWHLNVFACWTCSLFLLTCNAV